MKSSLGYISFCSFAIVLWEIWTKRLPFAQYRFNYQVESAVVNGERPTVPDDCPRDYCQLMLDCWQHSPLHRPTFVIIAQRVELLLSQFASPDSWRSESYLYKCLAGVCTRGLRMLGRPFSSLISRGYRLYGDVALGLIALWLGLRFVLSPNVELSYQPLICCSTDRHIDCTPCLWKLCMTTKIDDVMRSIWSMRCQCDIVHHAMPTDEYNRHSAKPSISKSMDRQTSRFHYCHVLKNENHHCTSATIAAWRLMSLCKGETVIGEAGHSSMPLTNMAP